MYCSFAQSRRLVLDPSKCAVLFTTTLDDERFEVLARSTALARLDGRSSLGVYSGETYLHFPTPSPCAQLPRSRMLQIIWSELRNYSRHTEVLLSSKVECLLSS